MHRKQAGLTPSAKGTRFTVSSKGIPRLRVVDTMAPSVAGLFYPERPRELRRQVRAFLGSARASGPPPKAIIAPHAGYRYSGAVAGRAYARLARNAAAIRRVVLLGPAHRVPLHGLATCSARAIGTPLGPVAVDREALGRVLGLGQVREWDDAFRGEHSLEVHLPFLKECLPELRLVPLLVGRASAGEVGEVLEALWGGPETAIVVSTDLSHYHDYDTARAMDSATSEAIEELRGDAIGPEDACGRYALRGLLAVARAKGLHASTVDLRSSGDTAGPRDRVVGYGAWVLCGPSRLPGAARRQLLEVAAASIRCGLAQQRPSRIDPGRYPPCLLEVGASFVTLRIAGALRGCMGRVHASRPLVEDVARSAYQAAFEDPRFAPLAEEEAARLEISISVLSEPRPVAFGSEADLAARLRPGIDGLILRDGEHSATFLPSVWKAFPEPSSFLRRLKEKADLDADHWSASVEVERYTAESFS